MALNYEVKKKVFGFDQTKTEKYVAQLKTLGMKSDTVYRRKIIFTPGQYFREMLTRASVTRASWEKTETVSGGGSAPGTGGNGEEENPLG